MLEIFGDFFQAFINAGGVEISFFELALQLIQHLLGLLSIDLAFLQLLHDVFELSCKLRLLELFRSPQQLFGLFQNCRFFITECERRCSLQREPVVIPRQRYEIEADEQEDHSHSDVRSFGNVPRI